MSRANPLMLAVFLAVVLAAMVGPAFLKGGVYLTAFEGDALHVVDVAMRMHLGQIPHLEFHTPLGAMAFLPIAWMLGFGAPLGMAYLGAQALMAALVLPLAFWAAWTRLPKRTAFVFAAMPIIVMASLSYGTAEPPVTIAMHYNRWAWALAFVVAILIALPPRTPARPFVDGAVLGIALAGLALIKAPYFVALAPVAVIALILRGQGRAFAAMAATGLTIAALATVAYGLGFWAGYVQDLLAVAGSDIRAHPGIPLAAVAVSPPFLATTLTAVAGALLLRQAGMPVTGLILFLLIPGFIYLTFQNFGNDPLWVIPLAVILTASVPEAGRKASFGLEARQAGTVLAAIAVALSLPHAQSLASGGLRHLALPQGEFEPMIASSNPVYDGIYVATVRANTTRAAGDLTAPDAAFSALAGTLDPKEPVRVAGEPLPDCRFESGIIGASRLVAEDIGPGADAVFVADMLAPHWMFTGSAPLTGAAPWNYGDTLGIDRATELVVPICAISTASRRGTLDKIAAEGIVLREVARTPRIIRYAIER
ncbi:MAG: hypothetical protein AAF771_10655 [Pseudomonadota bacterium]